MRSPHKHKLDDPLTRDKFLTAIRAGHGRYEAAVIAGVTHETYRKYYRSNPDFREEVEGALDASVEPVLRMLRDEANAGDISAAKEWLKHVAPPARSEKRELEVKHTHGLDEATMSSIQGLRDRLAGRTPELEPAYEEAEVIDETT